MLNDPDQTLRPAGFRLIELLGCIAIVALLALMTVPALLRARELARSTSCVSNLKELGRASAMYAQDHNGMFAPTQGYQFPPPPGYYKADGSVNQDPTLGWPDPNASWYPSTWASVPFWIWGDMLRPYLKSTDYELCPNNRRQMSGEVRTLPKAQMNYGANWIVMSLQGGSKVSNVKHPAKVFLLMDATTFWLSGAASGAGLAGYGSPYCASGINVASAIAAGHGCHLSSDGSRAIGCDDGRVYDGIGSLAGRRQYDRVQDLMGRHFDGLNVCYVDGHVRWMSGREMVALSRPGIDIKNGGLNPNGEGGSPWSPLYEN